MILSIDIGIKNLSLCIMDCCDKTDISTYNIHLWDVYNTLEDHYTCVALQKSGKICNKKCSFKYNLNNICVYTCKTHFPKDLLPLKRENNYKPKLIKNYLLQDIAKIILTKINEIVEKNSELFLKLTHVVLELQPLMNKSMIFVSHIIYAKLTDLQMQKCLNDKCSIKFVRASQKLRAYTGPIIECKLKGKYAQRKWLSIKYTKFFLENKFSNDQRDKWLGVLNSKSTQADMSDCCLMAINGLYGIPKKQKMNFKKTNLK
jgi:hypothetical protein